MHNKEQAGQIRSWNDDKGFGFIKPAGGGDELFAHISVVRGERRPRQGDRVLYVAGRDERGRMRAEHLRLAGEMAIDQPAIRVKPRTADEKVRPRTSKKLRDKRQPSASIHNPLLKLVILVGLCALPLYGASSGFFSGQNRWALLLYPLASLVCFCLYWSDKASAQQSRQRISEKTLHLTEMAGGWPGALIAQQVFRHKTRKQSYQAVFWLIVGLHQLFWIDQVLLGGTYTGGWLQSLARLL